MLSIPSIKSLHLHSTFITIIILSITVDIGRLIKILPNKCYFFSIEGGERMIYNTFIPKYLFFPITEKNLREILMMINLLLIVLSILLFDT